MNAVPDIDIVRPALDALAAGRHGDPFAILGPHRTRTGGCVRCFMPGAASAEVIEAGATRPMARIHGAGLFEGPWSGGAYRYRFKTPFLTWEVEDPYRFPPVIGDLDLHLLAEGTHARPYEVMGAQPGTVDGVAGTAFAVWAPNARRVSVIGDMNGWDARQHPMRLRHNAGIWELFLPGVEPGALYKYAILGPDWQPLPDKADPWARAAEVTPRTASRVWPLPPAVAGNGRRWQDRADPMAIYEVHLGSWRRGPGNRYLTYRELAAQLVPYAQHMGFTHLELMPVSEYPFDGSWVYQPTGLFAPTSRFGDPDDFAAFVTAAHDAGLGVLVDWVPGHFPGDPHGLLQFDGTALYEHADPRLGKHQDWDSYIYNYGRTEVSQFLLASALYWLERYDIDGLRVDAVASMIYRDYSRKSGEWIPNHLGGTENFEATGLLRRLNEAVFLRHPNATTVAEESTAWPMVSRPTAIGGLGFGFKWNMGWMHDTLAYMAEDPVHRKYHHDRMTFGLVYAFTENFVLPISHDEVVHGKRSLLDKMPGDRWQKFANLRAYLGFMYGHPGKKLLFMGCEFGQWREWNHDTCLDWHLLDDPAQAVEHRGMQALVRDLNQLYRRLPALHQHDCDSDGFQWIDAGNRDESVFAWIRRGHDGFAVVVAHFTPVIRPEVRIGVPSLGFYAERLNTDSGFYGGGNVGNGGGVPAEAIPAHGHPFSIRITLPPLATLIFTVESLK